MDNAAILFDFDGTLFFGTTDINYHAMNLALADMGREPIDRGTANTTVGDKIFDACRKLLGTDDPQLCRTLFDGIFRHAGEAIRQYGTMEADCVHMLNTLSRYVPLAICSNAEECYLNGLLEQCGVRPFFTHVWYARPGYDKARAIPELMGILGAERAIMVGDRAEDVNSGKANGCITVAMQNDFGARDAAGADYNVSSHREMEETLLNILQKWS